jgi:hypothetical protein
MSWFSKDITETHLKELKLIKYLMEKSNDDFKFRNPPKKEVAKLWNIDEWLMWLDKLYKETK